MNRGRGDLEVGILDGLASERQVGLNVPKHPRNPDIVGQDGDRRQYALVDRPKMTLMIRRSKRTLVEFACRDRADELVRSRDVADPLQIVRRWTPFQETARCII